MTLLKGHRKAHVELEGHQLTGNFDVSLKNQGDREVLVELITVLRRQLRNPTLDKVNTNGN